MKLRVENLALASSLLMSALLLAPAAMADYNAQMRAYHEQLLNYQVQPGRYAEQRKQVCQNLKTMTRANQNVDALWAKFDALERRVPLGDARDPGFIKDCNAFIKEANARQELFIKDHNAGVDAANAASDAAKLEKRNADYKGYLDDAIKTFGASEGPHLKRRQRIWDEIKRCHAMKKNVASHVEQFKEMERAMSQGKDVSEQCRLLENSLALPNNITD